MVISSLKIPNLVEKSLIFATKKHAGVYRNGGICPERKEEYITHPIAVAALVKKYKKSKNIDILLSAALLHDVIEDNEEITFEFLAKEFGTEVAYLVKELTSSKNMIKKLGKSEYLSYDLNEMSSWALVIKLCDRLHNISDYLIQTESFRNRYIKQTEDIIKYLEENRKNLTDTHKLIIIDIKCMIKECYNYFGNPKLQLLPA